MAIKNPVNLRGSLKQLSQEGRRQSNEEGSASCIHEVGAWRSGAVGAQPECTSRVGCSIACTACGERWPFVYRSGPTRRACGG
jgi:hypothetical protein